MGETPLSNRCSPDCIFLDLSSIIELSGRSKVHDRLHVLEKCQIDTYRNAQRQGFKDFKVSKILC